MGFALRVDLTFKPGGFIFVPAVDECRGVGPPAAAVDVNNSSVSEGKFCAVM